MPGFIPDRQFNPDVPEMMDRPDVGAELLKQDLRNLRVINRFLGGLAATRKHLRPIFDRLPADREIHLLDLASGSGDQARSIAQLARSRGRRVQVVGLDRNPVMLDVARTLCAGFPEISFYKQDILSLQENKWQSDIVLCSLAIHHFSEDEVVRLLTTMQRLSRVAFVVNDLTRHWWAAGCAWTYAHLTSRNPLTLHDTYVSVLRAFTPGELRALAGRAGIRNYRVVREPVFRLMLIGEH